MSADGDLSPEDRASLERAIADTFAGLGLVSDWVLCVEVAAADGDVLHHQTSENAVGWKAYGMALYLAAAQAPEPHYRRIR